jgi:hypothetical protein
MTSLRLAVLETELPAGSRFSTTLLLETFIVFMSPLFQGTLYGYGGEQEGTKLGQ